MKQSGIKQFFEKGYLFTFSVFVFSLGIGKINLKPYGIPFSFGGDLEKIIIWPLFFGFGLLFFKRFRHQVIPLSLYFIYIIWLLLAYLIHPLDREGVEYLVVFGVGISAFFLGILGLEQKKILRRLISLLILGALITVMRGLFHHFSEETSQNTFGLLNSDNKRLFSPIGHPNFLGSFLVLVIPFCIFYPLDSFFKKGVKWIAFLILMGGLIFSYSRTAWIAALVGLSVTGMFYIRSIVLKKTLIITGLIILNSILVLNSFSLKHNFKNPVLQRLVSFTDLKNDENLVERIYCWKATLSVIKHNWLFGIGPGNERFKNHIEIFREKESQMLLPHPHNMFFHIAVIFGIPGFIFFLSILLGAIQQLQKRIKSAKDSFDVYFLNASLGALSGLLVSGVSESAVFADRVAPLIWLCIAFLYYAPVQAIENKTTDSLAP